MTDKCGPKPRKTKTRPVGGDLFTTSPKPPPHLSDMAKEHWKRIAPGMVKARLLARVDVTALAELCNELSTADGLRTCASDAGWTIVHANGMTCKHPCIDGLDKCERRIQMLFKALGLTPEGRADLPAAESPSPSPGSAKQGDGFAY